MSSRTLRGTPSIRLAWGVGACFGALAFCACTVNINGSPDGGGSPDGNIAADSAAADGAAIDSAGPDGTVADAGVGDGGFDGSLSSEDGSTADARDSGGSLAVLTNGVLFRVDNTGTNLATAGTHVGHGDWPTLYGQQNIPGNYGAAYLFLSTLADPMPNDFLDPVPALSFALASGSNTLHFFANGDDMLGGTFGFGLNLWLHGAVASSPSISAFVATPSEGGTFSPDGTPGCTGAFDLTCTAGANDLSSTAGADIVTLTSFSITQVGGASAATGNCVDKVGGTNTAPTVVNTPDGICDTVGSFTLTVQ